jgi:hypothetical protein
LRDGCGRRQADHETHNEDGDATTSIHSSFLAFLNTSTIMAAVSFPVLVFWRLG